MNFSTLLFLIVPILSVSAQNAFADENTKDISLFYVDEPVGCFQSHQMPCAIRTIRNSYKLESSQVKIYSQVGSSYVLNADGSVRLLEGIFFIESSEFIKIDTGTMRFFGKGEFFIDKLDPLKVSVVNFVGDLKSEGVLYSQKDEIPAGFTKWYSGVNQKGDLEQGMLTALDPQRVLPMWRKVTSFSKPIALEKLKQYRDSWKDAVAVSAQFYQEVAARRIAAVEAKNQKRARQLEFEKQERQKLRQLFRQRNYLD